MKKYILSSFIIVAFIGYAVYQRLGSSNQLPAQPAPVIVNKENDSPSSRPDSPVTNPKTKINNSQPAIKSKYRDGDYRGPVTDAYYGNVEIKATIQNGKISDVVFLQYPNHRSTSVEINTQAMPRLAQEAIQAQSNKVDIVSGATQTSEAFIKSLGSALNQASTS